MLLSSTVNLVPDPNGLPGSDQLQQLTNGLAFWALILALAGMLIGAAAWAVGNHAQNYQQSYNGRRAVLASGAAALIIGAAPNLVSWFYHVGLAVRG